MSSALCSSAVTSVVPDIRATIATRTTRSIVRIWASLSPRANSVWLRPTMGFALMTLRAFEALRNGKQGCVHIEVVLGSKGLRLRRYAVPARVAT